MIKSRKKTTSQQQWENVKSEQPIGRQNDAQSPQRRDLGTQNGDQSHHWSLWGSHRAIPRWLCWYILAIIFEFSCTLASLGLDFGSPGVSHELCWRHKLAPRLIIAYFAATSFYYALVGGIWRTIGSSLDHTFKNLFICKSIHLVCCPSQRTHCCISKISKYTSLETRVSRTRKKVVD